LDNGLKLTFGKILLLAGDIYGTDLQISDGSTKKETETRFLSAFNTLNSDKEINEWSKQYGLSKNEVPNVLKIFKTEIDTINTSLKNNIPHSTAYQDLGNDLNVSYNVATGGGSSIGSYAVHNYPNINIIQLLPQGRMLKLTQINWDHFAHDGMSWKAYESGHNLALLTAANANGDIKLLERAYAYDAFSCHFLSDHFASGHLRTPRKELHFGTGSIPPWSSVIGDYLSKLMHDEENIQGLTVANNACYNQNSKVKCNVWKRYGDNMLAEKVNTNCFTTVC